MGLDHLDLRRSGSDLRPGLVESGLCGFNGRAAAGQLFRADRALVGQALGEFELLRHVIQRSRIYPHLAFGDAQVGTARSESGLQMAVVQFEQ